MHVICNNNNNNNNCLKSNIQCIEIRVQWTVRNDCVVKRQGKICVWREILILAQVILIVVVKIYKIKLCCHNNITHNFVLKILHYLLLICYVPFMHLLRIYYISDTYLVSYIFCTCYIYVMYTFPSCYVSFTYMVRICYVDLLRITVICI